MKNNNNHEVRFIYDRLVEILTEIIGEYNFNAPGFQATVNDLINTGDFEAVKSRVNKEGQKIAGIRLGAVKVKKFKSCEMCGRIFYDLSRNGRTAVCHYRPYEYYDEKERELKQRYKNNRPISLCEKLRDDQQHEKGRVSNGLRVIDGSAASYSSKTLERKEQEKLTWTSFMPGDNEDEGIIDRYMLQGQGLGGNGRRKGPMVIASDENGGGSGGGCYLGKDSENIGDTTTGGEVITYNIYNHYDKAKTKK